MVERIRSLIESRQLTPTQFADAIGVARPIISHVLSGRNKPSLDVVQRILAAMPELSMPWLLNGAGPMEPSKVPNTAVAADSIPKPTLLVEVPTSKLDDVVLTPHASAPTSTPADRACAGPAITRVNASKSATIMRYNRFAGSTKEVARPPEPPQIAAANSDAEPAPFSEAVRSNSPPLSAASLSADAQTRSSLKALLSEVPAVLGALPFQNLTEQGTVLTSDPPVVKPVSELDNCAPLLASHLLPASEKAIRRIVIFYHDGSFADYQPE